MTTARNVIANTIDHPIFKSHSPCGAADVILATLLSAPEPVRLELAALLNPWRGIETAPKDGTKILLADFSGYIGSNPLNLWLTSGYWNQDGYWTDGIERLYSPTHWLPLPAPPSEDKPK